MQGKALLSKIYICIKVYPCLAGTGAIKMQMWVLRMLMLEVENNKRQTSWGQGEGPRAECGSRVGAGMKGEEEAV